MPNQHVHASTPRWQLPTPAVEHRLIGGVAAAAADEIGVDPFVVRVAFLLLFVAGGWGALVYLVLWALMQAVGTDPDPARQQPKATSEANRLLGVGLVVMGLLVLFREMGGLFLDSLVWPLALAAAGLAMARERGVELAWGPDASGEDRPTPARVLSMAAAALLVAAAIVVAVWLNSDLATARETLIVVMVVIAVAVLTGPWVVGLVNDLAEERRARIRSDERAQVAAHLHDSVLQTLSLIQRRADDPGVVTLARKQERELRSWLYGRPAAGTGCFRDRLEHDMAEVEDLHQVPIEVVVVGDAPVDEALSALLAATREAAVNAAVHSGAAVVDVFAEVGADGVDVFVRDTGRGFDPHAVPDDRRGLADSIVGRIERAGGRVEVLSSPGAGTEIEMHVEPAATRGRPREQR